MKDQQQRMSPNTSEKAYSEHHYQRVSGASVQPKIGRSCRHFMSRLMLMIGWFVVRRHRFGRQWKHASRPKRP